MEPYKGSQLFDRNIEALAERRPGLARAVAGARHPEVEVLRPREGPPVLIFRGVSYHSRRDPEAEARRLAENAPTGREAAVFGFGLGWHVFALLERYERLLVLEPEPAIVKAAFECFDWTQIIPRLTLIGRGDDPAKFIREPLPYFGLRPAERLFPAEAARFRQAARQPAARPERPVAGEPWKVLAALPVGGGSLTVARYAADALGRMGHEVVIADFSALDGFQQSIRSLPAGGVQKDRALARLFEFAGEYVALLAEAHRPDLLLAVAQAPLDPRALARIHAAGVTTAFWFVEDYRRFGYFRELAPAYDFFFHIQGEEMGGLLDQFGARRHACLPLAADPFLFRPLPEDEELAPYRADVSFMGAGYPNRREVFGCLTGYDFKIFGSGWGEGGELAPHVQLDGRRVDARETVRIYNAARVNLNLHSSLETKGLDPGAGFVNPRTFEIAACGGCQVVDRQAPLDGFFQPGEEVAVYSSPGEMIRKIDDCLQNPEAAREMGRRARARVLAGHTYEHRLETLLKTVAA